MWQKFSSETLETVDMGQRSELVTVVTAHLILATTHNICISFIFHPFPLKASLWLPKMSFQHPSRSFIWMADNRLPKISNFWWICLKSFRDYKILFKNQVNHLLALYKCYMLAIELKTRILHNCQKPNCLFASFSSLLTVPVVPLQWTLNHFSPPLFKEPIVDDPVPKISILWWNSL